MGEAKEPSFSSRVAPEPKQLERRRFVVANEKCSEPGLTLNPGFAFISVRFENVEPYFEAMRSLIVWARG
jgi:hypothetical protein